AEKAHGEGVPRFAARHSLSQGGTETGAVQADERLVEEGWDTAPGLSHRPRRLSERTGARRQVETVVPVVSNASATAFARVHRLQGSRRTLHLRLSDVLSRGHGRR